MPETLREGMTRTKFTEYSNSLFRPKKDRVYMQNMTEATEWLADELFDKNSKLDANFATRLESAAYEYGRLNGWGPRDESLFNAQTYKAAQRAYELSDAIGKRAIQMARAISNNAVEQAYEDGKREGALERDNPLVDRRHRNISFRSFSGALDTATSKYKAPGKSAKLFIEGIVFPKGQEGTFITLREMRTRLIAARFCAKEDTQTVKIFDDVMLKLTGEEPEEMSLKLYAEELKRKRDAFLEEPIQSALTLDTFHDKIAMAILKTGLAGKTLDEVVATVGTKISEIGIGKPNDIITQPMMLRDLIQALSSEKKLNHKTARALYEAIQTLFSQKDFREFGSTINDVTPAKLQKDLMLKVVSPAIEKQQKILAKGKSAKGTVLKMTGNDTRVYFAPGEIDSSFPINAGTIFIVETADIEEKPTSPLQKVHVDGAPYYVLASFLTPFDAKVITKTIVKKVSAEKKTKKPATKKSAKKK